MPPEKPTYSEYNQFGFFDPNTNTWDPEELAANYQPPEDENKCQ